MSLSEKRNGIPNRNMTTRSNADTRVTPKEFYEPRLNQKIAIRELLGEGGGLLMIS